MPIKLRWPVDSRRVNQSFNTNPDFYAPFGLPGHEGLDLFAPEGANVYAAADGEVYQAGHPGDHPYGLHIRIRHEQDDVKFRTIYAHLKEIRVDVGAKVVAGQRIGLADNTGNSFGSHLHFTLKIEGRTTPGYPRGIVDPRPFLQDEVPEVDLEGLEPTEMTVLTTKLVNLRREPTTAAEIAAVLGVAEPLTVLGDADTAREALESSGWIPVKTAGGAAGFVFASLVQLPPADTESDIPPPTDLVVYPVAPLNLRVGNDTDSEILRILNQDESLVILGNADAAREQIGVPNTWLQVRTAGGELGYVSSQFVMMTAQMLPVSNLKLFSTVVLSIRAQPTTASNRLTIVLPQDALKVLGDPEETRQRLGLNGEWIHVRTPSGHVGFAAAHFLQPEEMLPFGGFDFPNLLGLRVVTEARMHAQASKNAPIRRTISAGTLVNALESDFQAVRRRLGTVGGWVHVLTQDGERGWLPTHLLSE